MMAGLLSRFIARHERDLAADAVMQSAARHLAPYLYAAHNEVTSGKEPEPWPRLKPAIRHVWTQRAIQAIRSVR